MPVVPVRVVSRKAVLRVARVQDRTDRKGLAAYIIDIRPAEFRDTNLLVVRRYCIIHKSAVILRDESESITTEICTVNDIPTSMCHIWTRFPLPIHPSSVLPPASGSVCESPLALARLSLDAGDSV